MSAFEQRLGRLGLAHGPRTGAVVHDDGSVTISKRQRQVHMFSETVAVVAVAPFMLWLATRDELPEWSRWVSGGIGVATLVVDGGLLLKYHSAKEG